MSGGKAVGDRTIEYDLRFLKAVLNWAVDSKFINANPCAKFVAPDDYDPQQPMLSREEYDAMQQVAMSVSSRFALALTLAWETGRRIGAIRHLRWADVDLDGGEIRIRQQSRLRQPGRPATRIRSAGCCRLPGKVQFPHAVTLGCGIGQRG